FADLRGSNDGSSAAIDGRAADLANITVPGVGGAAASRRGGTGGSGPTDNRDARSDGADVGADIRDASPADLVTVRGLRVTGAAGDGVRRFDDRPVQSHRQWRHATADRPQLGRLPLLGGISGHQSVRGALLLLRLIAAARSARRLSARRNAVSELRDELPGFR